MTDSNIQKVMGLLTSKDEKPITKKEACEFLNIAYNTQRLSKIIEDFEERAAHRATRRAQNRGKPAADHEVKEVAEAYLAGASISDISKSLYRSAGFVKNIIQKIGIPAKRTAEDLAITYLPEECVSDTFSPEEIVWSARYNCAAKVVKEKTDMDYAGKYGSKCYQIYVMEHSSNTMEFSTGVKGGYNAFQPAHDLGKLVHLQEYGLQLDRLEKVI